MFWAGLSAAVSMLWASWPMILSTRTKHESFYTKLPVAVRSSIPNEIQKNLCILRGIHSYSHRSFLLKSFLTSEEKLEMKSVLETASALGGTCAAPSGVCSGLCKSPDPLGHHSLSPLKYQESHQQMPGRNHPTALLWMEVTSCKLHGPNDIEIGDVAADGCRSKVLRSVPCQGFCLPRYRWPLARLGSCSRKQFYLDNNGEKDGQN